MSLHNAELETDLFYVIKESEWSDGYDATCDTVNKRGLVEAKDTTNQPTGNECPPVEVCLVNPEVEGAAEEIARALNRLPKMEALLIEAAAVMRGDSAATAWANEKALAEMLVKIEEAICS